MKKKAPDTDMLFEGSPEETEELVLVAAEATGIIQIIELHLVRLEND